MRCERRLPPCGLAATWPWRRHCLNQSLALERDAEALGRLLLRDAGLNGSHDTLTEVFGQHGSHVYRSSLSVSNGLENALGEPGGCGSLYHWTCCRRMGLLRFGALCACPNRRSSSRPPSRVGRFHPILAGKWVRMCGIFPTVTLHDPHNTEALEKLQLHTCSQCTCGHLSYRDTSRPDICLSARTGGTRAIPRTRGYGTSGPNSAAGRR